MAKAALQGAILGAGFFAGFQAEAWQRIPQAEITAVADPLPGRAAEFAARWNIPRSYLDAEQLLIDERPDFVDVATRPESHVELTELAARHEAHIICQKPMAPTREDAESMIAACRQANVRLLIHENWRWQPWYREVKRLVDNGELGELFHLSFRLRAGDGRGDQPYAVQPYFRQMKQLLIYETLVHYLDTFRFLGGEIASVYCQTARLNPHIAGEDYALIQLRFANGMHGLIDAHRMHGPVPASATLGALHAEGVRAAVRLNDDGDLFVRRGDEPEQPHVYRWEPQGYRGDSVRAVQAHCVQSLLTGERCESEGDEYLRTIDLVEACYRSAASQQPVTLPV